MLILILLLTPAHLPLPGTTGDGWRELLTKAQAEEKRGNYEAARRHLDAAITLEPNRAELLSVRGGVNFKLGNLTESLADFNAQIKAKPGAAAAHWRRGLTLYYLGKYAEGVDQFLTSDRAEPEDVENAVWHLLCHAQVVGLDAARAKLLRVAKDPRVPMREVYDLFAGRGTREKVLQAAEAGEVNEEVRRSRRFYAYLYAGLFEEMQGRSAKGRELIEKAVKDYPIEHYMMDVARIHLRVKK